MHQHNLTFTGFLGDVAMWQVMMTAMMLPVAVRWVRAWQKLAGGGAAAFASGYFLVWLGYSVVGAGLQIALQMAGALTGHEHLPARSAGLVLILAGAVRFTPFARSCLSHCRNPVTYFLSRWNNGPRNGFRLGLEHGLFCVGCCWALMLTGFATGLMNVLWMLFVAALISVEQMTRYGERIGQIAAAGFLVWGVVLLTTAS